jgi:hypothetical protein
MGIDPGGCTNPAATCATTTHIQKVSGDCSATAPAIALDSYQRRLLNMRVSFWNLTEPGGRNAESHQMSLATAESKAEWYERLVLDIKKMEFTGIVITKRNQGKRILQDELKFDRAEYGNKTIPNLARDLKT